MGGVASEHMHAPCADREVGQPQLAPGSSCVAALPVAKADERAGKAAAGAEDAMKGQGLRAATATPAEEIDVAKAGHAFGKAVPGTRL